MQALTIFATVAILASAQAVAADVRYGKPEGVVAVSLVSDSRERAVLAHHRAQLGDPEEFSPLAYGALALTEEGIEESYREGRNATRLYLVGNGERAPGASVAAPAAPAASGRDGGADVRQVKKASLPEPGSWAMILAGLLGVGAIARRRISV